MSLQDNNYSKMMKKWRRDTKRLYSLNLISKTCALSRFYQKNTIQKTTSRFLIRRLNKKMKEFMVNNTPKFILERILKIIKTKQLNLIKMIKQSINSKKWKTKNLKKMIKRKHSLQNYLDDRLKLLYQRIGVSTSKDLIPRARLNHDKNLIKLCGGSLIYSLAKLHNNYKDVIHKYKYFKKWRSKWTSFSAKIKRTRYQSLYKKIWLAMWYAKFKKIQIGGVKLLREMALKNIKQISRCFEDNGVHKKSVILVKSDRVGSIDQFKSFEDVRNKIKSYSEVSVTKKKSKILNLQIKIREKQPQLFIQYQADLLKNEGKGGFRGSWGSYLRIKDDRLLNNINFLDFKTSCNIKLFE